MKDLFGCTCPHCGQPMPETQRTAFSDFWEKVPHKIGKASAEKAWRKLGNGDRHEAAELVGAFYDWFSKTYPNASPLHPATYINGKRWRDDGVKPNVISHTDAEASIRKALQSKIPAVREHAERLAEKNGIQIRGDT